MNHVAAGHTRLGAVGEEQGVAFADLVGAGRFVRGDELGWAAPPSAAGAHSAGAGAAGVGAAGRRFGRAGEWTLRGMEAPWRIDAVQRDADAGLRQL